DPAAEASLFSRLEVPEGTTIYVVEKGEWLGEFKQPEAGDIAPSAARLEELRESARKRKVGAQKCCSSGPSLGAWDALPKGMIGRRLNRPATPFPAVQGVPPEPTQTSGMGRSRSRGRRRALGEPLGDEAADLGAGAELEELLGGGRQLADVE